MTQRFTQPLPPPGRRWLPLVCTWATLALSGSLWAQNARAPQASEIPLPPPSLRAAFDSAWQRQPEAAAQATLAQAARAQQEAAQSWLAQAPALELSTTTDRAHANTGAREYEAALALPLWLPGERARAIDAANAQLQGVQAQQEGTRWRLAGQVRSAWWAWQRAAQELALARWRVQQAQALAQDVEKRVQAGDLARVDALQAQGELAQAQADAAEAASGQEGAWQELQALTGWESAPQQAQISDEISPEALPDKREQLSESEHPALLELQAQAQTAQTQADLAALQTRGNPEITLGTTREREERGARYQGSLTLALRLPLGEGARAQTKLLQAQAQAVQAHSAQVLEAQRLRSAVAAAGQQWQAAQEREKASAQRATLAAQVRAAYEKSFRLGETDWPTRQRAEGEAVQAQRLWLRARLDAAAAASTLRQALGLWPQ